MEKEIKQLLALLPEYHAGAEPLIRAAEYFDISEEELKSAAEQLPKNHDLKYKGVRQLLVLCLEEFSDLFTEKDRKVCEVTVPAPPCALYAFQNACPQIRFVSGAFFAQIALRGILGYKAPIDVTSCAKRRCGLNKMRLKLIQHPPVWKPDFQLQFGVLCDECVKTGESTANEVPVLSVCFPKPCFSGGRYARQLAEGFLSGVEEKLGIRPKCDDVRAAFSLYSRLLSAENRLLTLNARPDRQPLFGNSFTLAQSVQLMTTPRAERFVEALELLADELEDADAVVENSKRIYCYFIPFLVPEVDSEFRSNGYTLVGNAAFLENGKHIGFDMAGIITAWLETINIRYDVRTECGNIAKAMKAYGCDTYLTGAFSFDRQLGSVVPLQRRILKEQYQIKTKMLDSDFWNENAAFGSILTRVDNLCI